MARSIRRVIDVCYITSMDTTVADTALQQSVKHRVYMYLSFLGYYNSIYIMYIKSRKYIRLIIIIYIYIYIYIYSNYVTLTV